MENHRVRIRCLDALDTRKEKREREWAGVVKGMMLIQKTFEMKPNGFRIEWGAVVEADAGPQMEAIGETTFLDGPGLREGRFDLEGAGSESNEPIVNVRGNSKVIKRRGGLGIQRLWFGELTDNKNIVRDGLNALAGAEGYDEAEAEQESSQAMRYPICHCPRGFRSRRVAVQEWVRVIFGEPAFRGSRGIR